MQLIPSFQQRRFICLPVVVSALLSVTSCSDAETAKQGKGSSTTAEVGFVTLQPEPVALHSNMAGRVIAFRTAEIRPQVGGIVVERVFEPGKPVKAGDTLFRLDANPFKAQLAAAEATLEKAKAALPSAQARAERYANLSAQTAVSEQDKEDAQSQFLQAKADIAVAEAAVETAQINLDYAEIRAPIDGIIGTTLVDVGTLLTPGQAEALATIRQLDPVYVDLTESSGELNRHRAELEAGKFTSAFGKDATRPKFSLSLPDGTAYQETGTLEARDRFVSQTTSSFTVRARFPNPELLLLPGQYVRGSLEIGIDSGGFLVPQRAISRNNKGEAVASFINHEDMVEKRVVKVSTEIGGDWVVTDGVNSGDRLVVEGFQKLKPGAKITPVEVKLDENGVAQRLKPSPPPATNGATAKNRSDATVLKD